MVNIETAEKVLLDLAKKANARVDNSAVDRYSVYPATPYSGGTLSYTFVLDNVENLNKFTAAIKKEGYFTGNIVRVESTKAPEASRELTKRAIAAAKNKAESMTAALGTTVGEIISIQEVLPPLDPYLPMPAGEGYAPAVYQYNPEEMTLNCRMLVRFALK
jgi:uncharacterized protein YggE